MGNPCPYCVEGGKCYDRCAKCCNCGADLRPQAAEPTDRLTEEQVKEWLRLSDKPACSQCGEKFAVCFGAYEHHSEYGYACGDCCGHGNEDGHCEMLDERDRDEWPELLAFDAGFAAARTALPALCHALLEAWERERKAVTRAEGHLASNRELRDGYKKQKARADAAEKRAAEGRKLLERIREHAVGDKPPETDPPRNRLQAIYGLVEAHLAAHPTPESEAAECIHCGRGDVCDHEDNPPTLRSED